MSDEFTPGQWIGDDSGMIRVGGFDETRYPNLLVADVCGENPRQRQATMRLFLASKDLLASCREMREAIAASMRLMTTLGYVDDFIAAMSAAGVPDGIGARAGAAIAKATGKAEK